MRAPLSLLTGAAALLAAVPALAHDGPPHDGLMAGLAHPVGGVDHLLATVGIGLVAGLAARASAGATTGAGTPASARGGVAPVALAAAIGLALGAAWTALGGPLGSSGAGAAELGVAAGLVALALAVLGAERLGPAGLAALALAVCLPHGALHGLEATGGGFFAGLALASAGLFALGAAAGSGLAAVPRRLAGRARWALAATCLGGFGWFAAATLR